MAIIVFIGLIFLLLVCRKLEFDGVRTGFGYDVHRLVDGASLTLCGVKISHNKGLVSFSDGDVATHAIIDALLGAAALPDIGTVFSDDDLRFKNMSSLNLLDMTSKILLKNKFRPKSVDVTIVAQKPILQSYVLNMRSNLSRVLRLPIFMVSVKATTEEGLGFTGTESGISAYCVASVVRFFGFRFGGFTVQI